MGGSVDAKTMNRILEIAREVEDLRAQKQDIVRKLTEAEARMAQILESHGEVEDEAAMGNITQQVIAALRRDPHETYDTAMLVTLVGATRQTIRTILSRLKQDGRVVQIARGKYQASPHVVAA